MAQANISEEWARLEQDRQQLQQEREEFERERKESGVEFKLFAGNLDDHTTEAEMVELFKQFGTIKELIMLKDRDGKSKRSCFIKYYAHSSAEKAIAALHDKVRDKNVELPMKVQLARPKLPAPSQAAQGRPMGGMGLGLGASAGGMGGAYGAPQSAFGGAQGFPGASQSVYGAPQGAYGAPQSAYGASQGPYGAPQGAYASQGAYGAQAAYVAPQNPYASGQMAPGFAPQSPYGAPATGMMPSAPMGGSGVVPQTPSVRGPEGCNLYINNVDKSASEQDVRVTFSEFGTIVSCKLFPQGYGFVSYDNPQSAAAAISRLNGMISADGARRLEVRHKVDKGAGGATAGGRNARFAPY